MKKRIALMLCAISCLMMLAGCSLSLVKQNENFDEKTLTQNAQQFVESWFDFDFAAAAQQYEGQMGDDQIQSYKDYVKMQKKHGALTKTEDTEYTAGTDSASVAITVSTKKAGKLIFTVTYDEKAEISDWKVEEYKSIGQTMGKAGLNTVMSMAIVFIVLVGISLLIGCFKFIGKIQDKKQQPVVAEEPKVEAAPVVEENLTDDLELVAVITAAIAAASETECTDGLVVRSIVRR